MNHLKRPTNTHPEGSDSPPNHPSKRPKIDFEAIKRQVQAKKQALLQAKGLLPPPPSISSTADHPNPPPAAEQQPSVQVATHPTPTTIELETAPQLDRNAAYFDRNLGFPKSRRGRGGAKLHFVAHGKYIQKADKIRQEERLAALKASVSATLKKVGADSSGLNVIPDAVVQRSAPPLVEWWDLPLTHKHKTYDSLLGRISSDQATSQNDEQVPSIGHPMFLLFDEPVPMVIEPTTKQGMEGAATEVVTPLTQFVQHPVPIPPANASYSAPRPAMLTKLERRKLRRQRRAEEQREKQDKIRLGLVEPDPPKVRLANLMRVLANEAIQDPTLVEANVRAQVEARRIKHERENAERKLNPDQRRTKIMNRQIRDELKGGVHVALFKCVDMTHSKIRFKITMNVQQLGLTGVAVILNDHHVICVEGGPRAVRQFKKLVLRRMKWTGLDDGADHASAPAAEPDDSEDDESNDEEDCSLSHHQQIASMYQTDISAQSCWLIWEGQHQERVFKGFAFRTCLIEKSAVKLFADAGVEHHWNLAKTWNPGNVVN